MKIRMYVCSAPAFSVPLRAQLYSFSYHFPILRSGLSNSVVMVHSVDASSGDMLEVKEQRVRTAQSSGKHRVSTWWKAVMQRHVRSKTSAQQQPDPPAPVYVTAADVMKTPREPAPVSDAKFYWRM